MKSPPNQVLNQAVDEADNQERVSDEAYSISLQINYEDTDVGGVVYYGNYLGYMERARNAYLRSLGLPPGKLVEEHQVLFVVTQASIKYLAPARLDDDLLITLHIEKVRGAEIIFKHQVLRGETCLVTAVIDLAVLHSETFRPRRVPSLLSDRMMKK